MKAVDAEGNASMLSIAALKNSGLNRWRGWNCAVASSYPPLDSHPDEHAACARNGPPAGEVRESWNLGHRCTVNRS